MEDLPLNGGPGLMGTLQNVQNVLKVAETAAPLIKQYGPLVRNIPTFLRLIKELGSSDSNESDDNKSEENDNNDTDDDKETTSLSDDNEQKNAAAPKLYI
ncbi:VrrA/YqfQ family protein [Alteribacillus bidgolensis]|uniref:YqfQ-like protein n=1 Tax=Alteribacillus bidgolensis TaxID=930129 RepID=A0A1G8CW30_9BACI|nr:VrrA/YqfQ family protein [Alteribacillus bidgolensis]SDH49413.1 YqfQ-like protein [Alteribacillus bidgolensis]